MIPAPLHPVPVGGHVLIVDTGVADLASAPPAAAYYVAYETGLTVNLPRAQSAGTTYLTVIDGGGGLDAVAFTVDGGGTASGVDPVAPSGGYLLLLRPMPPEFADTPAWGYSVVG